MFKQFVGPQQVEGSAKQVLFRCMVGRYGREAQLGVLEELIAVSQNRGELPEVYGEHAEAVASATEWLIDAGWLDEAKAQVAAGVGEDALSVLACNLLLKYPAKS